MGEKLPGIHRTAELLMGPESVVCCAARDWRSIYYFLLFRERGGHFMRVMIYDLDDYTWLAWFRIQGMGSLELFCV